MSKVDPGAQRRWQEKIRARAEGRAPAMVQEPVLAPDASVHDRYLAKLAARRAPAAPSAPAAVAETKPDEPKADKHPAKKTDEPKADVGSKK